jgi:hypothetical protein
MGRGTAEAHESAKVEWRGTSSRTVLAEPRLSADGLEGLVVETRMARCERRTALFVASLGVNEGWDGTDPAQIGFS